VIEPETAFNGDILRGEGKPEEQVRKKLPYIR
jgi:hypothetical protein